VYFPEILCNICKTIITNPMDETIRPVTSWLQENWLILALIISEVAALLPSKVKGIIHAILKVGEAVFKKSSSKS